jgi:hypothetical protein
MTRLVSIVYMTQNRQFQASFFDYNQLKLLIIVEDIEYTNLLYFKEYRPFVQEIEQ